MERMDAGRSDLFGFATDRLAWLSERQKVLADNIANANTPGFMPHDLQAFDSLMRQGTVAQARTDPMHLASPAGSGGAVAMRTGQRSIDGNGVALDEQMMKVADTDTQQRLVTTLYGRYIGLFQTALGKG